MVVTAPDGSVVLAGHTTGDWDLNSSTGTTSNTAGVFRFAAVKLNADGVEVWRWEVRTDNRSCLCFPVCPPRGIWPVHLEGKQLQPIFLAHNIEPILRSITLYSNACRLVLDQV